MPPLPPTRLPAQRDAVVEQAVVANPCSLADDNTHAVIDEKPPTDRRPGVDFDARRHSRNVAQQPGGQAEAASPPRMRNSVRPNGVHARVAEHDLDRAAGGGVAATCGTDVLTESSEDAEIGSSGRDAAPRQPISTAAGHFAKFREIQLRRSS